MTRRDKTVLFIGFTLAVIMWFFALRSDAKDKRVSSSPVIFRVQRSHNLLPMLPVEMGVRQEEGGLVGDGEVLKCEVEARVTEGGGGKSYTATVLKCGDKKFVVERLWFQGSVGR